MAGFLNQPAWIPANQTCFGCGYPLEALEATGRCPECGQEYAGAMLVLEGVPERAMTGPWYVRWLFPLVLVVSMFLLQIVMLVWIRYGALAALAVFVTYLLVLGFVLYATPRQRRSSSERFVFVPGAVVRIPRLKAITEISADDIVRVRVEPGTKIEWKRVGSAWKRVRLYSPRGGLVFGAGVACADASEEWVRRGLAESARALSPADIPDAKTGGEAGTAA